MSGFSREIPDSLTSEMESTVFWASAGMGVTGLLSVYLGVADVAIISGTWTVMMLDLANEAGSRMNKDTAIKIAAGILTGIGGIGAGIKLAQMAFAYTGIGTPLAMIANAGTNAMLTYTVGTAVGRVFLASDSSTSVKAIIDATVRLVLAQKS